jgi:[acyl-carrier-protein] S-malonyltransferase
MKVLFVFAGQGYQQDDLFDAITSYQPTNTRLNELPQQANFSLAKNISKLNDPNYTQLLIGAYQWVMYHELINLFKKDLLEFAGYSFGEVMAFLISAKSEAENVIPIIQYRSQLMTAALPPSEKFDLLSIKGRFQIEDVDNCCQKNNCAIAIQNSDQHFIVGGKIESLKQLLNDLSQSHLEHSSFLSIHRPSHTPFYNGIKNHLAVLQA